MRFCEHCFAVPPHHHKACAAGVYTPLQLSHALLQLLVEQPPACLPAWPPSGLALVLPLLANGADASAVLCTLCYVLRGVLDEFVLDEGEPEWGVGVAVALDPAWCTALNAKQQRYVVVAVVLLCVGSQVVLELCIWTMWLLHRAVLPALIRALQSAVAGVQLPPLGTVVNAQSMRWSPPLFVSLSFSLSLTTTPLPPPLSSCFFHIYVWTIPAQQYVGSYRHARRSPRRRWRFAGGCRRSGCGATRRPGHQRR